MWHVLPLMQTGLVQHCWERSLPGIAAANLARRPRRPLSLLILHIDAAADHHGPYRHPLRVVATVGDGHGVALACTFTGPFML